MLKLTEIYQLLRRANSLQKAIEESVRVVKTGDATGELTRADAVTTALYARYLKRVASHLLNILSSIVNPFDLIGYREPSPGDEPSR